MKLLGWIYDLLGICRIHRSQMQSSQTEPDWKGTSYPTLVCPQCERGKVAA
jgi:hypothetical protein